MARSVLSPLSLRPVSLLTGCAGPGVLLASAVLLSMPFSTANLSQLQALNRELGKLCSSPPREALTVCRIHARLVQAS